MAGLLFGLLGLFVSYAIARQRFSVWLSLLATLTVAMGSFVAWSLIREPDTIHPFAIAAAALACWSWMRYRATDRQRASWLAVCGAAAITAVVLRLQAGIFQIGMPPVFELLWSSRHGLFATSPALYVAALGLIPLWRRDRPLATVAGVVFALACLTATPLSEGSGGGGLGGRQFDVMIPFFICGMAAMLQALARTAERRPLLAAATMLGVLVLWNVTLMAVTRAGGHRIGEPVSFGDLAAAQAATLHDWIGHPASYPANLVYAARHRVAPGRYDVLLPNRFLADPTQDNRIDIGANDAPYLEDGWHAAERAGDLTFRWSQRESKVIIPLDHAADLRVTTTVRAFSYAGSPPQAMTVEINGHAQPAVTIGPDWQRAEWHLPRALWQSGVNRLTLKFVRETRPSEVGGGGDNRPLAAAIDEIVLAVGR